MVEGKEEQQAPPAAEKTPPAPEPKPEVEAPVDDLERERRLIARAITEATSKEQLEALATQRISKLPPDLREALRPKYNERSRALRGLN